MQFDRIVVPFDLKIGHVERFRFADFLASELSLPKVFVLADGKCATTLEDVRSEMLDLPDLLPTDKDLWITHEISRVRNCFVPPKGLWKTRTAQDRVIFCPVTNCASSRSVLKLGVELAVLFQTGLVFYHTTWLPYAGADPVTSALPIVHDLIEEAKEQAHSAGILPTVLIEAANSIGNGIGQAVARFNTMFVVTVRNRAVLAGSFVDEMAKRLRVPVLVLGGAYEKD